MRTPLFVATVFFDDRKRKRECRHVACKRVEDGTEAIARLDGVRHTFVTLIAGNAEFVQMYGGDGGFCHCWNHSEGGVVHILQRRSRSRKVRTLTQMGMSLACEDRQCVPLDLVVKAAVPYIESGIRDPELVWRRERPRSR